MKVGPFIIRVESETRGKWQKRHKRDLDGINRVSVSRPGIEQRFDGFPLRMREGKQTSLGFFQAGKDIIDTVISWVVF